MLTRETTMSEKPRTLPATAAAMWLHDPPEEIFVMTAAPPYLPPYFAKYPCIGFTKVEAQFHINRITAQMAHYYHPIFSLPSLLTDQLKYVRLGTHGREP